LFNHRANACTFFDKARLRKHLLPLFVLKLDPFEADLVVELDVARQLRNDANVGHQSLVDAGALRDIEGELSEVDGLGSIF
jgi:hypothetical protein